MPSDDETAKSYGWRRYDFRYLTSEREVKRATVYAADDETAAVLFNKAYGRDCREVLPQ